MILETMMLPGGLPGAVRFAGSRFDDLQREGDAIFSPKIAMRCDLPE
jgi:hypothetical protein